MIVAESNGPWSLFAVDLDGDGDEDVLATFVDGIGDVPAVAWYENTDGKGTFGERRVVATKSDVYAESVFAGDRVCSTR